MSNPSQTGAPSERGVENKNKGVKKTLSGKLASFMGRRSSIGKSSPAPAPAAPAGEGATNENGERLIGTPLNSVADEATEVVPRRIPSSPVTSASSSKSSTRLSRIFQRMSSGRSRPNSAVDAGGPSVTSHCTWSASIAVGRFCYACGGQINIWGRQCKDCNHVLHKACVEGWNFPCQSERPETSVAHDFERAEWKGVYVCQVCWKRVDSTTGLQCKGCKFHVHESCEASAVLDCTFSSADVDVANRSRQHRRSLGANTHDDGSLRESGHDSLSVQSISDMHGHHMVSSMSTSGLGRTKLSSSSTAALGIGLSAGARAYKENWRPHKPVMLIHGLCSSNLRCIKSVDKPAWEGTNVWLGFDKLMGNIAASDAKGVKSAAEIQMENERSVTGKLSVTIVSASDVLAQDDDGLSDPYCLMYVGNTTPIKTKVKRKTLNPVWNHKQTLYLEKESSIGFMVYDWDRMGANDMCGICELPMPLSKEPSTELTLKLRPQGTLTVLYTFEGENFGEVGDDAGEKVGSDHAWLRHMALFDGYRDPTGIVVRPNQGLDAVAYLETEMTMIKGSTYVFGPLIKDLKALGYTNNNLRAMPYDWRLPPHMLEIRDQYFTRLKAEVEAMYEDNEQTPVVVLGHSMGVMCAHYFLHWAARETGGREWADKYVDAFMAAGGPWLGAYKTMRATVFGDDMGLGAFVTFDQARTLCRAFGSSGWLYPVGTVAQKQFLYMKRAGALKIVVHSGDLELITDKRLRPKIYGDERSPNPVMALTYKGKTLWTRPVFGEYEPVWEETCQFAIDEGKLDLNTVLTVELKNKIKGKSRTAAPLVGSATLKLADILKDAELADILKDTEKQWDCEIVLKKKVGLHSHDVMKLRLSAIYVPPEDIGLPDTSTPNPNLMPMAVKEYFYQNGAISNYNQYMEFFEKDPIYESIRLASTPVKKIVNVYGVNCETEAGYIFSLKNVTYSPDNVYKLRWKLDTKDSDRFKSDFPQWILRNGVLFEHRNTKQADLEGYGTRYASGDGTVPYESLRFPLSWVGETANTDIENKELEGLDHRGMLAAESFISYVISVVGKKVAGLPAAAGDPLANKPSSMRRTSLY